MITITKPFVFLRLKMKLASLMKHKSKKRTDDGCEDMREYVDLSWRFSHQPGHQPGLTREVTPGERLGQLLTTLPHYDLLDTWLDTWLDVARSFQKPIAALHTTSPATVRLMRRVVGPRRMPGMSRP